MNKKILLSSLVVTLGLTSCGVNTLIVPTTSSETTVSSTNVSSETTTSSATVTSASDVTSETTTVSESKTTKETTSSQSEVTSESTTTTSSVSSETTTSSQETTSETTTSQTTVSESVNVYMVGDSTMCSFNDAYYYPRFGYGTQMANYFDTKVTFNNLALSGRSSKSFLLESNYETLKSSIKAGDYLIIGFGHNDEKYDDTTRFTDASKDVTDSSSFKYSLYENYIKVAESVGAYAILATPICRLSSSNDYSTTNAHNLTASGYGDYAEAIRELGNEKNVPVVDLTSATKEEYTNIGYDEAKKYHAVTSGTSLDNGVTVTPNYASIDNTHINYYGANYVAYTFANLLKNTNSALANYVKDGITKPTEDILTVNPSYKWVAYTTPDLASYTPASQFMTTSTGWYGTAFGDCGGDPSSAGNGYYATETSTGTFKVGQSKGTEGGQKGKITSSSYGIAFAFMQISKNDNFTLTVSATILEQYSGGKQAGFGLMLRDDCYLPVKDASITSNYVAAGLLLNSAGTMSANFAEASSAMTASSNTVAGQVIVGSTATFTIKRLGQVVTCTTVYEGETYTTTYTDFDFVAKDSEYMYVGMFGARGIIAEYTNVSYTYDGEAQAA